MSSLRVLIVGYGRMGRQVEAVVEAADDAVVADRLDVDDNANGEGLHPDRLKDVDVAIDFSTAEATVANLPRLAEAGVDAVVGTTGWHTHEDRLRAAVAGQGIGVVAAANFSLGVNLFLGVVEQAARLLQPHDAFGAWLHETHHAAKVDAPSGTALTLESTMRDAGYERHIDVSSTRVGHVPGTHTVGFDGPSDTITLTHAARDRATFARGALVAARWVHGRRGWFTMRDVLGLTAPVQGGPR